MKISYQKELEKIKEILKEKPRGVTTREISQRIGINRNAIGKYLDVLQISGEVDVEKFGRSKVYFLSKSVPISKLFDHSNDFIIVITKDMMATDINSPFVKYLGAPNKNKIIGKKIQNLSLTKDFQKMPEDIKKVLDKQEIIEYKIKLKSNGRQQTDCFHAKYVPTVLKDGEKGVTIILKKIN